MKYVAITKTVADLEKPTKLQKKLPKEYPLECKEYETFEEALAAHPYGQLMSTEQYNCYQSGIKIIHRHVMNQKPWWKLWGKK